MQSEQQSSPFDNLISEHDRAQIEGRSVRTLQRERLSRKGPPFIKIGRRVYYRRESYEEWLLSHEQEQPRAGEARQ